jgi:hypothetical protein
MYALRTYFCICNYRYIAMAHVSFSVGYGLLFRLSMGVQCPLVPHIYIPCCSCCLVASHVCLSVCWSSTLEL